ncbi:MAG: trypsin-like peptidase domain-containing protein [Mesorhizobium sp.]|nr:MAG: serine protease [Mesorhizobium sp.]TIP75393.1 MAG: trypsin-like peptidase domain-containing protein [Mesorhizobium sp.]TIQ14065.1 MAG: trypsin-like peptidase domain-containing protein [Mesorhizobium sp.]TIR53006.1 MAG: trypsin-like peptidase domain-containing protein [Mesorhizobium sp.]TJV98648.1 MAG: trypsin-like peptidase domain-containing protein [Mesorhizobium sp.]
MARMDISPPPTAANSPLTPDDLIRMENQPATRDMPAEVLEALSRQVIYVSTTSGSDTAKLALQAADYGSSRLILPKDAYSGLPVRSTSFLTAKDLQAAENVSELPGYKPDWFPNVFHPRHSTAAIRPVIKSLKGNTIIPEVPFPPENRSNFFPSGYPWHCVGRLFIWNNASSPNPSSSGTAVLVGPRLILTASHMLPWGAASWKTLFVPGYFDGNPVVGAGAASWCSDYRGYQFEPDDQAFDMAILRLYDPLGGNIGWMGAKTYSSDWQDQPFWKLVGYPGDAALSGGQRPTIEQGIRVLDDDSDGDFLEIEHRADTSDGNSGGPLFAFWKDGPYVIATHGGYEYHSFPDYENHNVAAGGKGMVNLINWGRANWP